MIQSSYLFTLGLLHRLWVALTPAGQRRDLEAAHWERISNVPGK